MGDNLNNVREKSVVIALDKERHFKFDMNAFAELEEKFGDVEDALKALQGGKIKAIRTILWAGLLWEDETLTEKQVGGMLSLENMPEVMEKVNEAILMSLPSQEEKKEAEDNNPN
jgi:hypothetical protein